MIMDFSFGGGGGANKGDNQVGITKKCGQDEIFDHLHNRCHAVICGALFINENGVCQPRNVSQSDDDDRDALVYSGSLNSTCKRLIVFEHTDYYLLENGSLVLNKTGQMLHPDEYEMQEDGDSVQICIDTSHQVTN